MTAPNWPTQKKVLCALPVPMLDQVDYIAKAEHRTRSDLIREALRRYIQEHKRSENLSATRLPVHD